MIDYTTPMVFSIIQNPIRCLSRLRADDDDDVAVIVVVADEEEKVLTFG